MNTHARQADLLKSMRIGPELEARGLIDLGALVTHRYALAEVDRTDADLASEPPVCIKAVVHS